MSRGTRQSEEVARRFWRDFSAGDPAAFSSFDPDVLWRTYGTGPNSGEFRGLDEVLKMLAALGQRAEGLRLELVDVLASSRGAVLHYSGMFQRESKTLEAEYFVWLRIEDGTVVEVATVPLDQARVDAFWKPH